MYATWTVATLAIAGYGIARSLWGLMLASVLFNTLETAGTIAWATAKQRHVPPELLGRVSSLDWLISIGLLPLSYALAGPVSAAVGLRTTLIGAGLLGALVTFAPLLIRKVRRLDDLGYDTGGREADLDAQPAAVPGGDVDGDQPAEPSGDQRHPPPSALSSLWHPC
jgi:DHA3 family tetracycline resistance protein-like MFS transporter